jgi:hypothetical protein
MRRAFNFIINIFVKDTTKPVGRWNIEHCSKKINRKIDLSNEDHCGPCGQYLKNITLTELISKQITKK